MMHMNCIVIGDSLLFSWADGCSMGESQSFFEYV